MAEQLTVNKIKDSYIAYMNAHYVSDEDARRIKDEFDRLRAENAKLQELFNETLIRLVAANEAAGGGFMDARYCELLESHGIEASE